MHGPKTAGEGGLFPRPPSPGVLPTRCRSRSAHPQLAVGSAGAVDSTASRPVCRPITVPPQLRAGRRAQHVVRPAGHARPGALGDLAGQLARRPARVAGEDPQAGDLLGQVGGVGVEVDEVDVAGHPPERARPRRPPAPGAMARHSAVSDSHGPPDVEHPRLDGEVAPAGQHVADLDLAGPAEDDPQRAGVGVVEDVDDGAGEGRVGQRRAWRPAGCPGRRRPAVRRQRRDGGGTPPTGRGPRRRPGLGIGGGRHRRHRRSVCPTRRSPGRVAPPAGGMPRSVRRRAGSRDAGGHAARR